MKRRVAIGAALWLLLITTAHVLLNVGWSALRKEVAVRTGQEREELRIGFLPVT